MSDPRSFWEKVEQIFDHRKSVRGLWNIPVLSRDDPTKPGPGIPFFHDLVSKRLAMVAAELAEGGQSPPCEVPIPTDVIDRLAYYSGGLVREFVRMVAFAAMEAWDARADAITEAIVDETLRDARALQELRITKGEIELLESVMLDPDHKLPLSALAHEQLRQQRLLPFLDDKPWYYPNPLLTLVVLKPERQRDLASWLIEACADA